MRRGFTLVELSIVLVIIGLIIGSVMVGKDLIRAGEIRKTLSQKESFDTAANTFKLKYGALPGDLTSPTRYGFSGSGNGDGAIHTTPCPSTSCEQVWFWQQLYDAKLIKESAPNLNPYPDFFPGDNTPISPISNPYQANDRGSLFRAGGWQVADLDLMPAYWYNLSSYGTVPFVSVGTPLLSRAYVLSSSGLVGNHGAAIKPVDAAAIDSKIDDGSPLSGNVIAVSNSYSAGQPGFRQAPGTTGAVYGTQNTYMLDLIIRASF
jgi:prepilin-type N-terminal cleavage/methylation domain-containing protein